MATAGFFLRDSGRAGSSSTDGNSVTTPSVTINEGDLIVIYVNINVPDEGTTASDSALVELFDQSADSSQSAQHALYWKIAEAGDTTFTFSWTTNCARSVIIGVWEVRNGSVAYKEDSLSVRYEGSPAFEPYLIIDGSDHGNPPVPANALSIVCAGKDNRGSPSRAYTFSEIVDAGYPDGGTAYDVIEGDRNYQASAMAARCLPYKINMQGMEIKTSDGNDGIDDYTYSSHVIFTFTSDLIDTRVPGIIRRPWTRQPPPGTPIDWNNSLAQELIFVNNAVDNLDLVNNFIGINTGVAPEQTGFYKGIIQKHDNTQNEGIKWGPLNYGGYQVANELTLLSIFTGFSVGGNWSGYESMISFGNSTGDRPNNYLMQTRGFENNIQFAWANTGAENNYRTFTLPTNYSSDSQFHTAIFTVKFGTGNLNDILCFIDGYSRPMTATSGDNDTLAIASNSNYELRRGARYSGDNSTDIGYLSTYIWNRALTDIEVYSISKNPWQIFKPQTIYLGKPEARRVVVF